MPEWIGRDRMSRREQQLRSQLVDLLSGAAVVRGSLSRREKVCGKPACRCARGDKHLAFYLVASEGGRIRQLYVPRTLEAQARQWVEAYQQMRELLEELSQLHWDKLKRREL